MRAYKSFDWYEFVYDLTTDYKGQIWLHRHFYRKNVKTVDFTETIAACDLKVGRCRQLKECEY